MSENKIDTMRHSASHVMAAAVKQLYGDKIKFAIGPTIEDGFYYDFDLGDQTISQEDLTKIEKKMKHIIKQNLKFTKEELSIKDALKKVKDQPYKKELIKDLEKSEKMVSFYQLGDVFEDLCSGPHVDSTKDIGAFKLLKVAGAYWRGDEKNKMLQRIYGTAFASQEELDDYMQMLAEAEKRDHRKIGTEQELFMIDDEVGQGLILWQPKGAILRREIMNFALNTYLSKGYEEVITPHIASSKLWSHSGHLDFYADDMYNAFGIEDEEYRLKPMNCPLQVRMYKSRKRSYRELPIRWTEMGTVYRYERSGTLHGLTRVRGFTQDDAHIICTPEQLKDELKAAYELTLFMLKTFGFTEFEMNVSVRDPENKDKFIGNDEMWNKAESTLKEVLEESGNKNYTYDIGGAVFYGPKIDVKVSDALGRKWQLSTLQFDFNLPTRFKMSYVGENGKDHTPFMIHRALLGSLERFIGVLIEHYGGAFPLWLSPVQVKILPVSDKFLEYAKTVAEKMFIEGIRHEIDDSAETLGKKIRNGELEKVPYLLIIGEKEVKDKKVAVRKR
ncbi:threonine--tRNA ligase, partial [Patescibacteria group bacterium]